MKEMSSSWGLNLFDRLHVGHQVMIDRLSEMPKPVACVTGGELVGLELELAALVQPIGIREKNLRNYLKKTKLDQSIAVRTCTEVDDLLAIEGNCNFVMYEGPCCTEIESGALKTRKKKMRVRDTIEYLKPVRAHDGGKLASARIRLGEIDREGRRLRGTSEPPRELPLTGRKTLKSPKGELFSTRDGPPEKRVVQKIRETSPSCVIAVGDVTASTILKEGHRPNVIIVDGITKRGPFEEKFTSERVYTIYNPPAAIYPESWSVIDTAIQDELETLIMVEGEEDLLGFPAVLLAPDNSAVLYGQPDEGIVWIPVNEENRKIARTLLEKMPVIHS